MLLAPVLQDVVRHIEKGYRMEPPEGCPRQVAQLMLRAWQLRPDDRPTFTQMHHLMVDVELELSTMALMADSTDDDTVTTVTVKVTKPIAANDVTNDDDEDEYEMPGGEN